MDSQTSTEILGRLTRILGESQENLKARELAAEKKDNPANFGKNCDRYCICSIPGQLPCPSLVPLPKFWRGKYHFGQAMDEEEE